MRSIQLCSRLTLKSIKNDKTIVGRAKTKAPTKIIPTTLETAVAVQVDGELVEKRRKEHGLSIGQLATL